MLNMKVNKKNHQSMSLIKTFALFATLTVSLLNINTATAAGNIENGEQLSQTCLGCHGAPGLRNPGPVFSIPMLGAQNALKEYRSGDRQDPIMAGFAKQMTIQDIEALAAWFASQDADGVVAPKTNIFKFK